MQSNWMNLNRDCNMPHWFTPSAERHPPRVPAPQKFTMLSPHAPRITPESPPTGRWWILAIVSIALLLIVIDMTVLYTALPRLTHELQASASAKLWIVNAYALVVSGLLLGTGTLGDRLGHKRMFMAGLVVFGCASLAAAFAPGSTALIAARAVLGVGAAMMMPATLSLIRLTFTNERERALAIGIWASVASGGAAFGPVLGGVLLEHFWWGSVFLINVPIALLALPAAWKLIPHRPGKAEHPWDWLGCLQVMAGLVACTYAIKELGKPAPEWRHLAAALVLGVVMLGIFARRQLRSAHPLLDFKLFRHAPLRAAVMAALASAAALIGMELVFSQRLQLVAGHTPLEAGWAIVPLPLAAFVAGPIAGRLLHRWGSAKLLCGALLLSGAGMAAYVAVHQSATPWQVVALAVLGFGIGASMTAASSTIMMSASAERAGMAASVEEVSYELGGALGVTVMGSMLSALYARQLTAHSPGNWPALVFDSLDDALAVAQTLPSQAGAALVGSAQAAFDHGYVWVLLAASALLVLTAWLAWRATDAK